jgi:hypothetical protein
MPAAAASNGSYVWTTGTKVPVHAEILDDLPYVGAAARSSTIMGSSEHGSAPSTTSLVLRYGALKMGATSQIN